MIAPNGNGPLQGNGPSVMASDAGQGAVNHSEQGNYMRPLGATPPAVTWAVTMLVAPGDFDALLDRIRELDGEPLICPCNSDPYGLGPCQECQAEIDALRARRPLVADGEPRDVAEDLS